MQVLKTLTNEFKKLVVRSPLHKLTYDIKGRIELSKFSNINDQITGNSTVYCISPYKTGTTYLAGCYAKEVSAHEPLDYLSLKQLDKNFNDIFIRRLNTLNLKFECSGFFSAYIDELAAHPIAKDLNFVVILRSPSSWITSTVNFWAKIGKDKHHFHIDNELFWKKKIGIDLNMLLHVSEKERALVLEKLIDFYMGFTKKTQKLNNVYYIQLKEIDSYLPALDRLIGETSNPKSSKVNANKSKVFWYENDEIDREYENLVKELTHNA
jgi:hypothetical protein